VNLRGTLLAATLVSGLLGLAACSGSDEEPHTSIAELPAVPSEWVVSLGDSYIAGEGDRWAGNTNGSFEKVDALGTFAYAEPDGLEAIAGCHQARLPEVAVNYARVRGKNLACSGAETATKTEGKFFKPGIDFYRKGSRIGQALALQQFAAHHDVKAVVLSIGGNDFNFSTIVTRCVEDFVTTDGGKPTYCSNDPTLKSYFSRSHVADVQQRIEQSIENISTAMQQAGKKPSDYRIIVQDYPSPVPAGNGIRYPETVHARFDLGGCPFYDRDATWANRAVVPTINDTVAAAVQASGVKRVTLLDLANAFVGNRLCEKGVQQMQQTGLQSWRSPGAANDLEWVNQIYVKGVPWQTQESAHPNYWGTAAERNCLRQVIRETMSGRLSCTRAGTAMAGLEPRMRVSKIVSLGTPAS
jgi:hypothetical protein